MEGKLAVCGAIVAMMFWFPLMAWARENEEGFALVVYFLAPFLAILYIAFFA
jgi:hypothetical protein